MSLKLVVLLLVASLGLVACQKIEKEAVEFGTVGGTTLPFTDAVPKDYGPLVGISPGDGGWTTLWFQKPDGTITAVGVDWVNRKMTIDAAVISRR